MKIGESLSSEELQTRETYASVGGMRRSLENLVMVETLLVVFGMNCSLYDINYWLTPVDPHTGSCKKNAREGKIDIQSWVLIGPFSVKIQTRNGREIAIRPTNKSAD